MTSYHIITFNKGWTPDIPSDGSYWRNSLEGEQVISVFYILLTYLIDISQKCISKCNHPHYILVIDEGNFNERKHILTLSPNQLPLHQYHFPPFQLLQQFTLEPSLPLISYLRLTKIDFQMFNDLRFVENIDVSQNQVKW